MAVSKQAMRNAITGYQQQRLGSRQILIALAKRKDEVGKTYNAAINAGIPPDEIAAEFGLKLEPTKSASDVNKNPSFLDKVKATAVSAGMGLSDAGAGITQGALYLGDKINHGINSTFGTHMQENAYDQYNKNYKNANAATTEYRHQAGRTGTDFVRGGTNAAATLPMLLVGGGETLAARAATQGAIGAGIGAVSYAEDSQHRLGNMAGGAIGGAVGQGVGEKIIAPVIGKTYNALKGNVADAYKPLIDLSKKFNVRTSAGDLGRNPIIKKAETNLEQVPVVGMAGFRQAQHGEAKTAANNIAGNFQKTMSDTDYKALPQLQQAADAGDRNAARVLGIVNNAGDDTGKVMQASMEIRGWREKQVASKLYDKVGEELNKVGNTTVAPTKTQAAIDAKLAQESKSLAPDDALVRDLTAIQEKLKDPNVPKDFNNMRLLRSQLGDLTDKYMQGSSPNKTAARFFGDLRQNVESDISNFVDQSGNDNIKTTYQRADGYYKNLMAKQDRAIANAMDSNKPDEIYGAFIKAGKGDRASNFYSSLDQKGQSALRYQMVNEALDNATNDSTGMFSPAKFAGVFERLREPYGNVFTGEDKAEMDGFVKLMRHVERAGQFMENPPTGNRMVGVAIGGASMMNPAIAAQIGGVAGLAKTLFTTKAGKNLLLASSKLDPGSTGMQNVVGMVGNLAKAAGVSTGVDNGANKDNSVPSDTTPEDTPPIAPATPTAPAPTTDAAVSPNAAGYAADSLTANSGNAIAPVIAATIAPVTPTMPYPAAPQADAQAGQDGGQAQSPAMSLPQASIPSVAVAPSDTPDPSANLEATTVASPDAAIGEQNPLASSTPTTESHIKTTMQSLIPPTAGNTGQGGDAAINQVFSTPQMQKIVSELDQPAPNDTKIKVLQRELAKTDAWKSYVENLPKVDKIAVRGGDVLGMITRMPDSQNTHLQAPHF